MVLESKWITGPPFLRQEEVKWPKGSKLNGELPADPEVLSCSSLSSITGVFKVDADNSVITKLWMHYFSWHRLQKAVA